MIQTGCLPDHGVGAAAGAGARQFQGFAFGGGGSQGGTDGWRPRRSEDGNGEGLRVQVFATAGRFQATLELTVVAFVAGVGYQQVVTTLVRTEIQPAQTTESITVYAPTITQFLKSTNNFNVNFT